MGRWVLVFGMGVLALAGGLCAGARASEISVVDHGAVAGGVEDCTAAFQAALDGAAAAGGGVVSAPAGRYRFNGRLMMPDNVVLRGTFAYAPAHAGIRDKSDELPVYGTVLEPYADAGMEEAPAFITLNTNSALQGVTVHYPAQKPDADAPTPYPYAIAMRGNNPAVIDVQLLNPYNGIDASHNQRALIRNVHGQPLHIGIYVDAIYDIGRIENVHWNPWWSLNTPVYAWQMENGIGFYFEKTDWHYVLNTFCFGYKIGYYFGASERGGCNGNFLGIGADDCYTAIQVDETAPMGVLITNGEFVSFHGPDPTMLRVTEEHGGTLRFVNCAFWGPTNRIALIEGTGTVGFSDCTFMEWGHNQGDATVPEGGFPALDVRGGSVLVRGCDFMAPKRQITLGRDVERAIVSENLFNGEKDIVDRARGKTIIKHNIDTPGRGGYRKELDEQHGYRAWARRQAAESEPK